MVSKRLLILLPANQIYGQERAFITLAQVLRQEGFDCHFLTHRGWGQLVAQYLAEQKFKTIPLPLGTLWSLSMVWKDPRVFLHNLIGVLQSSIVFLRLI